MRRVIWKILGGFAVALLATGCGGGSGDSVIRFTVSRGSGVAAVADTLAARDVIDAPLFFRLYAQISGKAGVKAGVYEVERGASWSEILRKLDAGEVVRETVVIPEGWGSDQIAARIAGMTDTAADSVLAILLDDSVAAKFDVPGPTLEGYLYPATYRFPLDTSAREMINAMVRRYKDVWTAAMRARADSLGLDERAVVTLASIVEKEAKHWEERDTIAAVYRNRLAIGMPLQADPTVQYALGTHQARLLYAQIRETADHPYNTYTHAGLPPGPIASPSAGAIRAVLYPADVKYLYFVARPDGSHVFTSSLAAHNAAKRRIRENRPSSDR